VETFVDIAQPATVPADGVTVSLPLSAKGLTVAQDGQGGIQVKDSAGRIVSDTPPARIWDAAIDPASRDPAHQIEAPTSLVKTSTGWSLSVTVPASFLSDPAVAFPVTVDPVATIFANADTYVLSSSASSNYGTDTGLRVGTYNAGVSVARSLLAFPSTSFAGTKVTSAKVHLFQYFAQSCAGTTMYVSSPASSWSETSTWVNQPASSGVYGAINSAAGGGASCPAGWLNGSTGVDVTSLVDGWASGSITNRGIELTAANETDSNSWRSIYSHEIADPSLRPSLSVTFNHYPNKAQGMIPTTSSGTNPRYVNTLTPQLQLTAIDPDGGPVFGQFTIYENGTQFYPATGVVNGSTVTSGGFSTWRVPSGVLSNGHTYRIVAQVADGTLHSTSLTAGADFVVDTTAPAAPTVTSSAYPSGAWATTLAPGSFRLGSTSTDVDRYSYAWDSGTPTTVSPSSVGGSVTATLTPPAGYHTLAVKALDQSGNYSTVKNYAFGVTGMSSPQDGDKTLRYLTLNAASAPGETGVRFQYRRTTTDAWADIPVAQVTQAGAAVTAWPVSTVTAGSGVSAPSQLVWDAQTTLGADSSVQLQAVFTGTSTITSTNVPTVNLDSKAYGLMYASTDVGVGSVSLQTGNLAVSDSDADVASYGGGLSVSRTFNSLEPGKTPAVGAAVFGPGWTTNLASQESDWAGLEDLGSQVRLTDADGGLWSFTKTAATTWAATGDAKMSGYRLTANGTVGAYAFTLTDLGGGTVTFEPNGTLTGTPTATSPHPYRVKTSQQAGVAGTSSFAYNTDATPAALFAPAPGTCTTASFTAGAGCRGLFFTYTGTGTAARLSKVTFKAFDATGASVAVDVACYTYDGTIANRLQKVWDPRLGGSAGWGSTCGTPVQATTYAYVSGGTNDGKIASITPPGLAPITVAYDGTTGKFTSTSRTHSATYGGATLTTTVLYGVSIAATTSSDDTHPDLSAGRVAAWGQTSVPLQAAAVFGPGDTVSSTDLKDATVYAFDADGRTTNTASYSGSGQDGWRVDSTDYDTNGNTVRELSAANRDRALNPATYTSQLADLGLDTAPSQQIGAALSTTTLYTADGVDVTDVYGPAHRVVLLDGVTTAVAREHDHTDYGTTDYPTVNPADWTTGAPLHVKTRDTQSATLTLDAVPLNETDTTETRYAYGLSSTDRVGWDLRSPMATTLENGTTDITRQTRYDGNGNVIEQRQPTAAGSSSNPGTRVTTYYTAGAQNPAACTSAAWYGQVCTTSPGAQPTTSGLPGLVTTRYTYDTLLRPTVVTETVTPAAGGSTTRTTTTTYGNAGASSQVATTAITGGDGTTVPTTTLGYDTTTGLPLTVSNGTKTQTTNYDDFGQATTYTDGDGAKTTTTRDTVDRAASVTWTNTDGVTAVGSQTYSYINPSSGDHRGELATITDSALGAITGTYNPLGELTQQSLASGLHQTFTTDTTGDTTSTTWADASNNLFLSDTQLSDIHGRWRNETLAGADPGWNARTYTYDQADRLTTTQENRDTGECWTRTYTLDINSNRTAAATYPGDTTGACTTNTTPTATQTLSYDNADRLLNTGTATGISYDSWGRTTTLPAALTATPSAGNATTTYYGNDLARSVTQASATRTWTLDPGNRVASLSTSGLGATALVNHYSDGSADSPVWTLDTASDGGQTTRRYIPGLAGLVAEADKIGSASSVTLQLTTLHGDVVRTSSALATLSPDGPGLDADEFGTVRDVSGGPTTGPRYGWLGTKERGADTGSIGLVLMGVRLFSPATGRFLTVDPVYGGNANPYVYPADPVNGFDLDGRFGWGDIGNFIKDNWVDIALTAACFIPGGTLISAGVWALSAVRVVRAFEAGEQVIRATRATSWLAGKLKVGFRGVVRGRARNGARWYSRGNYHWRSAAKKGRYGWSSNLEYMQEGHHSYRGLHIEHRPPRRWAPWW
jgi:RHS repeat-associated protein